MFDNLRNLRKRLSAAAILAGLLKPIPVGTVTGRLTSDEPNFEEVPAITQTTEVPADQQVIAHVDDLYEGSPVYQPLELDYSKIEAHVMAAYEPQVKQPAQRTEDGFKLMQIPRDPGLSATRRLSVSSKMAAAWNKLKPSSLSAEDVARLDAAQQKRDRKAAKRADDRDQFVFWADSHDGPRHVLRGDRNAYAVL